MIKYEENRNDVGVKKAALEFLSYAEAVGAIREGSAFLRESLMQLFAKNTGNDLEQFNRLTVEPLNENRTMEAQNG
jgi:hypothetical protein